MPDLVWWALGGLAAASVAVAIARAARRRGGPRPPEPEPADEYIEALDLETPEPPTTPGPDRASS